MDASIQAAITAAAQAAGVDPNLALAVANQESGGKQSAVSPAGAIGIFQLMPATAAGLGVNPNDATQNIQGGISYLAQMLNEFGGDVSKALAAYNWGPAAVSNAISNFGSNWLSSAPAETQNYVASILGVLGLSSISSLPAALSSPLSFLEAVPAWGWAAAGGAALLLLLL
jgi:soluble lytic murein transglycosylase-like protein